MRSSVRVLYSVMAQAALLLLVFGSGCSVKDEQAEGAARSAPTINVRVHAATNRVFEQRLTVQGTLEAKRTASVAARVGGNLDALWVDEGDRVEAGVTQLFQIDPLALSNACTIAAQELSVAQASLLVAEANMVKIEAEAEKVALDKERYERLYQEKRVSANEYELAMTRDKQAQAGIAVGKAQIELTGRQREQAEAKLVIARKNLSDSLVVAPLSGVISERLVEPGEQMSVGRAVVTIVDPTLIEAAAFVPAQYYHETVPGKTKFRLGLASGDSVECDIYYRSPVINPKLRTFEIKGFVKVLPEHAALVTPGAMAPMTLLFAERSGIGVPTQAVLERRGVPTVFVVKDNKAVMTPVTTGLENEGFVEILSGLAADSAVMVEGQTLVRDNEEVTIIN